MLFHASISRLDSPCFKPFLTKGEKRWHLVTFRPPTSTMRNVTSRNPDSLNKTLHSCLTVPESRIWAFLSFSSECVFLGETEKCRSWCFQVSPRGAKTACFSLCWRYSRRTLRLSDGKRVFTFWTVSRKRTNGRQGYLALIQRMLFYPPELFLVFSQLSEKCRK